MKMTRLRLYLLFKTFLYTTPPLRWKRFCYLQKHPALKPRPNRIIHLHTHLFHVFVMKMGAGMSSTRILTNTQQYVTVALDSYTTNYRRLHTRILSACVAITPMRANHFPSAPNVWMIYIKMVGLKRAVVLGTQTGIMETLCAYHWISQTLLMYQSQLRMLCIVRKSCYGCSMRRINK